MSSPVRPDPPRTLGEATAQLDALWAIVGTLREWMVRLYGPDVPEPMDFGWIMERVRRCEAQIWSTAKDVALRGGNVVLDLVTELTGARIVDTRGDA